MQVIVVAYSTKVLKFKQITTMYNKHNITL